MDRKYIAFISYRHKPLDAAVAKQLHTLIEQYRIPKSLRRDGKKRFGLVFRDQEELPLCPNLPENIRTALEHSEYLIVVCTPDTKASHWVQQEIDYFLHIHNQDRSKVFLVLAAGEAGDVFPRAVTEVKDPQTGIVTQIEPLAANIAAPTARQRKKKLRSEVLRLFAAILGCHYDAIAQREQRRQRQRIISGAAVVLAVALGFSGMLLVKNRQIQQANEALSLQKKQVQQRESELLTQNALEALEAGDYAAAIRDAVDALPADEQDDRPYYAPAEQVLFEALDVWKRRENSGILLETELEQNTQIADFIISRDGTRLVTIDLFGTFNGFDTATGALLWTAFSGGSLNANIFDDAWPLMLTADGRGFISLCGGFVEARDFEDGTLRWRSDYFTTVEDCLVQSGDGSMLACLTFEDGFFADDGSARLNILSCDTGELLHSFPILENISITDMGSLTTMQSGASFGGFSDDGSLFAGCILGWGEGTYTLHYYVADLTEGTLRIIRSEKMSEYYTSEFVVDISFEGNDALLVTRLNPEGDLEGSLEKIDVQTGEVLWKVVPDSEADELWYSYGSPLGVIHDGDTSYLYREENLFVINRTKAQWECAGTFSSEVAGLTVTQDVLLSAVTADGRYVLVWQEEDGLYSSKSFGTQVQLGDVKQVKFWNGGFLRAQLENDVIVDLSTAGENERRGFVALIPAEAENRILIKRSKLLDPMENMQLARISAEEESVFELYSFLWGDTLVLGTFNTYNYDPENGQTDSFRFVAVDADTLEVKKEFFVDSMDGETCYFLPDLSGYVNCDEWGNITLHDAAAGKTTVLSEEETEPVFEAEDVTYVSAVAMSTNVRRLSDEVLLTAKCTREGLTLWTNGAGETVVPLPEGLVWQMQHRNIYYNRCFVAGENGYLVISSFEDDADGLIDGFAAYDTVRGTWTRFGDAGDGEYSRAYCLAQSQPLLAVTDLDGTTRVYDVLTGAVTAEFAMNLPGSSIVQMLFACGDSILVVKTQDQQLVLYDIASGRLLYREARDSDSMTRIWAYTDEKNHRLYIADAKQSNQSGLCLETRSWTKLYDLSGFIRYDAEKNVCYSFSGSPDTYLIRRRIPSTAELVAMGREFLGSA